MPHTADSYQFRIGIKRHILNRFVADFHLEIIRRQRSQKRQCKPDKIEPVLFHKLAVLVIWSWLNQ